MIPKESSKTIKGGENNEPILPISIIAITDPLRKKDKKN